MSCVSIKSNRCISFILSDPTIWRDLGFPGHVTEKGEMKKKQSPKSGVSRVVQEVSVISCV